MQQIEPVVSLDRFILAKNRTGEKLISNQWINGENALYNSM
jgi:hypothetical protein